MIRLRHSTSTIAVGLSVLWVCAAVWAQAAPDRVMQPYPPTDPCLPPTMGQADERLLDMVPADSLFCLRVNNFEYTVREVDRFLTGISPIPMVLSMASRVQLAGLLGNPQLTGVNVNGSFVLLGVPVAGASAKTDPLSGVFVVLMMPVTNYGQFISTSPNCGQADAQGISEIKSQSLPQMLVGQAGSYAVIALTEDRQKLATMLQLISSGRSKGLATVVDSSEVSLAAKDPIWLYANVQQLVASFGPAVAAQLGTLKVMMPNAFPTDPNKGPTAEAMDKGFEKYVENNEIQTVTMSITPKPNLLSIGAAIVATPGTKMAATLTAGSQTFRELAEKMGAKEPGKLGADLPAAVALLPQADKADFVGMYNLMDAVNMGMAMSPFGPPKTVVAAKGSLAVALRAAEGRLYVDAALPREHLAEVVAGVQTMQKQMTQPFQATAEVTLPDENSVSLTEVSRSRKPQAEDVLPGQAPDTTVVAPGQAGPVRIGGVRLVRQSDYEAGILPLGQNAGYTLALVADLPEPAVRVSGGTVQKASTDSGKSLLPARDWDRRIRLARLSKDNKTVVFEVELMLPDENARGLDEVSGTIEYLTGTGTRQLDFGLVGFEAGAKGKEPGSVIDSIEVDPWRANATVVAVRLDQSFEAVQSAALYAEDGTKLDAGLRWQTSIGRTALLTIFVNGALPSKGRIVLNVYDQLQKNEFAFKVGNVSLTGEPMI